ncbi:MAG: hypothetical protein Greene041662_17 [Candidatus Peregrinibacteria bacterium Greene0416_62]|nr:MAG: hypothetical protein Greene041662_17 [Candidatus Peregrinibacteria bacterium Greene0416_62]TSC99754.1 MAG: hypothetical protein Greene101449_531 [Candidatus Peregrinibacteria bacterium Greene1014_49]
MGAFLPFSMLRPYDHTDVLAADPARAHWVRPLRHDATPEGMEPLLAVEQKLAELGTNIHRQWQSINAAIEFLELTGKTPSGVLYRMRNAYEHLIAARNLMETGNSEDMHAAQARAADGKDELDAAQPSRRRRRSSEAEESIGTSGVPELVSGEESVATPLSDSPNALVASTGEAVLPDASNVSASDESLVPADNIQ